MGFIRTSLWVPGFLKAASNTLASFPDVACGLQIGVHFLCRKYLLDKATAVNGRKTCIRVM